MKAARVEVARAMSTYTMAAVEARKLAGEVVPMDASQAGVGKLAFTLRLPIGVVGAICPFNFPLNLVAHKIAPALAAGCAVVLKPASQTPLSALLLAELELEAGLPAGLAQRRSSGRRRRSATSSSRTSASRSSRSPARGAVGWKLRERAPRKRVNLELGNATPVIVEAGRRRLDDAATKLRRERVLLRRPELHLRPADLRRTRTSTTPSATRFLPRVEALVVGDPADEETDVGPLIAPSERDRVLEWIEEARAGGATILTGRRRSTATCCARPSSSGRRPTRRLACDEVFGPVCTLQPYDDARRGDRARERRRATGSRRGSSRGDLKRASSARSRALEFGGVTVNEAPTFRADQMPYGGVKDSGNTREGPAWAVREMTEERLVVSSCRAALACVDRRAHPYYPARVALFSGVRRADRERAAARAARAAVDPRGAAARARRPDARDVPARPLQRRRSSSSAAPSSSRSRRGSRRSTRSSPARAACARRQQAICTCGAPILVGARFCPSCGRALDDDEDGTDRVSTAAASSARAAAPASPAARSTASSAASVSPALARRAARRPIRRDSGSGSRALAAVAVAGAAIAIAVAARRIG